MWLYAEELIYIWWKNKQITQPQLKMMQSRTVFIFCRVSYTAWRRAEMMSQSKSRSNVLLMLFYCITSAMKEKYDHKRALKVDFVTAYGNLLVQWFEICQGHLSWKQKESFQLRHWELVMRYSAQHIIYVTNTVFLNILHNAECEQLPRVAETWACFSAWQREL